MNIFSKYPLSSKYQTLFNKSEVNTTLRLANFFGQAMHESGLKPTVENLNYSVDGLMVTFSRIRISADDCKKYGRSSAHPANQEAIANTVYGGEWGKKNLGNIQQGDGWKFRGRGIFQITGRSNYEALTKYSKKLGLTADYISNPDLLLNEADSLIGALWFWNAKSLNSLADKNDILGISKTINLGNKNATGTPKGLKDREIQTNKFKEIFK